MEFKLKYETKPYTWQQDFVDYTTQWDDWGCLMQMRLGKTRANLMAIEETIRREGTKNPRVLVVCPSFALNSWLKEFELAGLDYVRGYSLPKAERFEAIKKSFKEGEGILLLNQEGLEVFPDIACLPWDFVLIDESTALRNPKSQLAQICLKDTFEKNNNKYKTGFLEVGHKAILTGLIAPEKALNIFNQIAFINGNRFMGCGSYYDFRNKFYFQPGLYADWTLKKDAFDRIKKALHERCFIKNRSDVNLEEKKHYDMIYVSLNNEQKNIVSQLKRYFSFEIEYNGIKHKAETKSATTRDLWIQQTMGGFIPESASEIVFKGNSRVMLSSSVIEAALNHVKESPEGEKFVFWVRYIHELKEYELFAREKGFNIIAHAGQTVMSVEEQIEARNKFQEDPTVQIIICTVDSATGGIDFSAAKTALYLSNSDSGEIRAQTEDRIVTAKSKDIFIYDVCHMGLETEMRALFVRDKNMDAQKLQNNVSKIGKEGVEELRRQINKL